MINVRIIASFMAVFAVSLVLFTACGSKSEDDANMQDSEQHMEQNDADDGMHDGEDHEGHDHEGHDHGEEPDVQTASTKYYCPMKCEGETQYDAPGSCPKCGMDLEKVSEKDEKETMM